jgi:ABC-type multidrug transport system permease subunit
MATIRIAGMIVRVALRTKVALFFTFIFPLLFLFFFDAIFAHGNPGVAAYLFGSVVTLQILGSSFFGLGLQSVVERERGSLRRYRLAPIGPGTLVVGNLLASYALLLPTVALLVFCGMVIFHMPLTISIPDLWILVTVGMFAFAGFGLTIASMANTMQEAQIYNNVVWFPLLFLSGATFPLPMLPHWVQRVAAFLPATYLVETFQGIMSNGEKLAAHSSELLVLMISGIFGVLFAWKLFRWEKDEVIPRSRQLIASAFVLPFIAMGVWMNSHSNFATSWSRAFNRASNNANRTARATHASSITPFLGRWDLTLRTPTGHLPSWIQISEAQGQPKILMVGVTGNASPLKKVEIAGGEIEFLSPKGDEGFNEDTLFKGRLVSGRLVGTTTSPGGVSWRWIGRRAPALKQQGSPVWGAPVTLFDGRDFKGWRFSRHGRVASWSVQDGTLIRNGTGAEMITTSRFMNFKLHVEFDCGPMSNSGVYLRGRYEVQIETDSAQDPPLEHMGAVYGFLAPRPELPRKPGQWQSFDITLVGRTVTVAQNGQTIIDHREIPGITGGALDSHEGLPGPIYLQGSEKGRVAFRNIVITPAK